MRGMWGRWVKGGKEGEVCGAQENPPRDTGEVSRGAFSLVCEIMWRLPYLEQVGRVVAIGKDRAISFDSLLRFASHAHPSASLPHPFLLYHSFPYHTIPYIHASQPNFIAELAESNPTRIHSHSISYSYCSFSFFFLFQYDIVDCILVGGTIVSYYYTT